jgi:hypothetical protein
MQDLVQDICRGKKKNVVSQIAMLQADDRGGNAAATSENRKNSSRTWQSGKN